MRVKIMCFHKLAVIKYSVSKTL